MSTNPPAVRRPWYPVPLLAVVLVVATIVVYAAALDAPFVLDDLPSIVANPTIRQLWPLSDVLATPRGTGDTVDGRPMLNLSFALNHAITGLRPWSYRACNVLLHAGTGLLLFGIVRRSLHRPGAAPPRWSESATPLAAAAALVWLLHPLNTIAVTYVVQRAESLMAFFLLLTLYSFIRSVDTLPPAGRWRLLAVFACFAGMATKESMAAAPLVVFLYDRTFLAGTLRGAWQARGRMHLALASSWLLLGGLISASGGRGGTSGFGANVSPWHYALTQCQALAHYVRQSFWPTDLVFDYGTAVVTSLGAVAVPAGLVVVLLAAATFALVRYPAAGFMGAACLLVLAPSSSVVPVATQTIAEHRMYLPLAILIVGLILTAARWGGTIPVIVFSVLVLAPVLGVLTVRRNQTFRHAVALWEDTVAKRPDNPRAFVHLGTAYLREDQAAAAEQAFRAALQLAPDNGEAHANLGTLLLQAGRIEAAIAEHRAAVQALPTAAAVHASLGQALIAAGQGAEAVPHLQEAWRLDPALPGLARRLGTLLLELRRGPEAIPILERASQLAPADAAVSYDLGNALLSAQRVPEAITQFEQALALEPNFVPAHNNLGNLLLLARRPTEALPHFVAVVERHPDSAAAHTNLGLALVLTRDLARAEEHFRTALRLDPNYEPARANLARLEAAR